MVVLFRAIDPPVLVQVLMELDLVTLVLGSIVLGIVLVPLILWESELLLVQQSSSLGLGQLVQLVLEIQVVLVVQMVLDVQLVLVVVRLVLVAVRLVLVVLVESLQEVQQQFLFSHLPNQSIPSASTVVGFVCFGPTALHTWK